MTDGLMRAATSAAEAEAGQTERQEREGGRGGHRRGFAFTREQEDRRAAFEMIGNEVRRFGQEPNAAEQVEPLARPMS